MGETPALDAISIKILIILDDPWSKIPIRGADFFI